MHAAPAKSVARILLSMNRPPPRASHEPICTPYPSTYMIRNQQHLSRLQLPSHSHAQGYIELPHQTLCQRLSPSARQVSAVTPP